jgi:two-component system chemotaxis response regulator CheB
MLNDIKIVIIGGSAGSYNVVKKILAAIPEDFSLPLILCLHRLKDFRNGFVESLNIDAKVKVKEPLDKEPIKAGSIYLCPANYHVLIEPGRSFALSTESDINYSRPSIDLTFETGGYSFRDKMAGIILSGANTDGARGLYNAHQNGAYTVVQDPANARFSIMPGETLKYFKPDQTLTDDKIVAFINSLNRNRYV